MSEQLKCPQHLILHLLTPGALAKWAKQAEIEVVVGRCGHSWIIHARRRHPVAATRHYLKALSATEPQEFESFDAAIQCCAEMGVDKVSVLVPRQAESTPAPTEDQYYLLCILSDGMRKNTAISGTVAAWLVGNNRTVILDYWPITCEEYEGLRPEDES